MRAGGQKVHVNVTAAEAKAYSVWNLDPAFFARKLALNFRGIQRLSGDATSYTYVLDVFVVISQFMSQKQLTLRWIIMQLLHSFETADDV